MTVATFSPFLNPSTTFVAPSVQATHVRGFSGTGTPRYPAASALPLGVIELATFVLYLVPKTRFLGGLLMLAYLGGAVATHVHADDGKFAVPIVVGIIAWLGLFLRDRKLRALVPLVDE
jgi:hypothetical protein